MSDIKSDNTQSMDNNTLEPNYWRSFEALYNDPAVIEAKGHEFKEGVTDDFEVSKLSGLSRRKLEEGISIQVQQAMMKMEEAKKRITAQQKSLQQADKALKISQTRFKSGVGTQLELIDTQAALTFANTNYAQAIYDYLMAKAEWEYSVSVEE